MVYVYMADPDCVSYNLAIFICKRCASIHQSLGSRISKLKPVNDESWTEEQLQVSTICCVCVSSVIGVN